MPPQPATDQAHPVDGGAARAHEAAGQEPGRDAAGEEPAPDGTHGGRDWVRAALSPRMLAVLLVLLVMAGACVRLGAWQLDRATAQGAAEAQAAHAERLAAEPQPIAQVVPAQSSFPSDAVGSPVTAVGAFQPEQQVLVPDRAVGGEAATLVVSAFRLSAGPDAGAMLPVVRGWVDPQDLDPQGEPVDQRTATALAVPQGELEITGYLQGSEASVPGRYPDGMVGAISAGQLANLWGGPSWSGYLVLAADSAGTEGGPAPADPPAMTGEQGLNVQNLAYAAEWWIFGLFALLLGWRMLRDEVRHQRADALPADGPVPAT